MEALILPEEYKDLHRCIIDYPCVLDIFHNIRFKRPLKYGVRVSFEKTLDLYIENLFIPLMLKYQIISKDDSEYGLRANYTQINLTNVSQEDLGTIVANGVEGIRSQMTESDSVENTLFAYLEGEEAVSNLTEFMRKQRDSLRDFSKRESLSGSDARKFKLAFAFHIDREK